MTKESKASIIKWIRILHRDIGFLVVGLTAIYAISGFALTYRNADIFKTESRVEKIIQPGLAANELGRALRMRGNFKLTGEDDTHIQFTSGKYNKKTGEVSYVSKDFIPVIKQFNSLHFVSGQDSRHWFTATYAILLLFLALSSFGMYKPGTRLFKRGLVLAVSGGVGSLLLLML